MSNAKIFRYKAVIHAHNIDTMQRKREQSFSFYSKLVRVKPFAVTRLAVTTHDYEPHEKG